MGEGEMNVMLEALERLAAKQRSELRAQGIAPNGKDPEQPA